MADESAITGIEVVNKTIGKSITRAKNTISEALHRCAEIILQRSQKYVPVDTGALKASGQIVVEGNRQATTSRVIYGGKAETYYALYVHENLEAKHAAPTCAKFLERAARESAGNCQQVIIKMLGGRSRAEAEAAGEPGNIGKTLSTNRNYATKYVTGSNKNVAYQNVDRKK